MLPRWSALSSSVDSVTDFGANKAAFVEVFGS
jgi:hypothetical protein